MVAGVFYSPVSRERMSAPYVELRDQVSASDGISKESLYNIHQSQLSNQQTNEAHTHQLVMVLGGIDNILSHYLAPESNIDLFQIQISQINDILANSNNHVAAAETDNENETKTLEFNSSNTFLHKFLRPESVQKMIHIVSSQLSIAIISMMTIMLCALAAIAHFLRNHDIIESARLVYWIIMTLWGLPVLLTMNIKAFRLSIKQFIFWFKIGAGVQYSVSLFLEYDQLDWKSVKGCSRVYEILCMFLVILAFCTMDGFHVRRRTKIIFSIVIATVVTIGTIDELSRSSMNPGWIQITSNWSISLKSVRLDAMKVLSIFTWRQVLLLMLKSNKCVNIQKSPYLKWVH